MDDGKNDFSQIPLRPYPQIAWIPTNLLVIKIQQMATRRKP